MVGLPAEKSNKSYTNYNKFDRSISEINSIYLNIFETFINFKKQVEKFFTSQNSDDIIIPNDSDISQPKLGNTLFDIIDIDEL